MFNYFSTESLYFIYLYIFSCNIVLDKFVLFSVAVFLLFLFICLPFRWSFYNFFTLFFRYCWCCIFLALANTIFYVPQLMVFFLLPDRYARAPLFVQYFFSSTCFKYYLFDSAAFHLCTQCLVFCGNNGLQQINIYVCMFVYAWGQYKMMRRWLDTIYNCWDTKPDQSKFD